MVYNINLFVSLLKGGRKNGRKKIKRKRKSGAHHPDDP